jgi:hypothetical protein
MIYNDSDGDTIAKPTSHSLKCRVRIQHLRARPHDLHVPVPRIMTLFVDERGVVRCAVAFAFARRVLRHAHGLARSDDNNARAPSSSKSGSTVLWLKRRVRLYPSR